MAEGQLGVHLTGAEIKRWRWTFRDQPVEDYGVDCEAEAPGVNYPTGRLIGLQVKTGRAKYFKSAAADGSGWWYSPGARVKGGPDRHLRYWLEHDKRIVLVLVDESTRPEPMYWVHVTLDRVVFTGGSWKIFVPACQPLDATAQAAFRAIADAPRSGENADVLAATVKTIPPQVGRILTHLGGADHFRALQLAVTLSRGSADPVAVVERLLGKERRYLAGGDGLLYVAVAAYAGAHNLPAHAARAFLEAAQLNEHEAARYLALSAWSLVCANDRVQAQERVGLAEAAGAPAVLCAWIHAAIAHKGPGAPNVPRELVEATKRDVDGSPLYRLFLAHAAANARDVTGAVRWHEEALTKEPDSSQLMLNLATALLVREASNSTSVPGVDLSRALMLATDARDQRRRWAGPSEDAVVEIIHALQMATDFPTALRFATPAPFGEAIERESTCATVAFLGAKMALALRQEETAHRIAARVVVGSPHARAVELMLNGHRDLNASTAWLQVLEEALDDPDLAVYALHQAAACGLWPIENIEQQYAEGFLTVEGYETLRARSQAARGETDAAARTLRPYLSVSAVAAESFVEILEDCGLPDAALAECERALERFGNASLAAKRWNLLLRLDRTREAVDHAYAMLARSDFPAGVRTTLREFIVSDANERHDWHTVEEHCTAALREGSGSPLLAWAYIGVAYNRRRWTGAWERYVDLTPPISTSEEAVMWLTLHARHGFSEQDVLYALELFGRFPDDQRLRGQVIAIMLTRGDKLGPDGATILPLNSEATRVRLQAAVEEFLADNPDGLRVLAAGSVPETSAQVYQSLTARSLFDTYLQECLRNVTMPLAAACCATGESYAEALLKRAHGPIIAVAHDLAEFEAELGDAAAALDGSVLLDASALAVLCELPEAVTTLLGAFAEAAVDDETHFVCLAACSEARQAPGTVNILAVAGDGKPLTAEAVADADLLVHAGRADQLEKILTFLTTVEPADPKVTQRPWRRGECLAIDRQSALWCDDVALRREARAAGCRTFGTVALLHVLAEADDADIRPRILRLATAQVGNIVLQPDEISALAIGHEGFPGPAAAALASSVYASDASGDDVAALLSEVLARVGPLGKEAALAWVTDVSVVLAPYLAPEHVEPTLNVVAATIAQHVTVEAGEVLLRAAARVAESEAARRDWIVAALQQPGNAGDDDLQ